MSAHSQNQAILAHFRAGGSLTSLEALEKFGCLRLASRVSDLREMGHDIKSVWEKRGDKKFKRYYLPSPRLQAIQATPAMKQKVEAQSLF